MGKQLKAISTDLEKFIKEQKMFTVGTARSDGRVNVSPKGMDSLRILGPNQVVWLNLTGSGNETASHLIENDRMTILFSAFEGRPLILRLYGKAKVYHQGDPEFEEYIKLFPTFLGSRQILDLNIDLVQTSCGFGVPLMKYQEDRTILKDWAEKKGEEALQQYKLEKNSISLDGHQTGIK